MQILHNAPYAVSLRVDSLARSEEAMRSRWLFIGLLLGALAMVCLMAGALEWLSRDAIYAWYCAYAIAAGLACASHAGLAHQMLWPVNGLMPGVAVLALLMIATGCQLQFSRLAFVAEKLLRYSWLPGLTHLLTLSCALCAIAFFAVSTALADHLFHQPRRFVAVNGRGAVVGGAGC
ncbi:MAG: hypothetical protein HC765_01855 [Brachymonas sp.]|nr:hypothetical protein [Brachymonas sp.]